MRSLRAVLLVTVLALAWVGVLAGPAKAHALLERSYRAAGASLSRTPHAMLLYFPEAPEPGLSTISLLDSSGQIVPGVGTPAAVPGDAQGLRATLPTLTDGVYSVNWRTVSKVDGHVSGGSFAFGIGIQPPSASAGTRAANGSLSTGSTPAPAAVAGLWLLYCGLALLAAAGATGVLVFGWRLPGQAREVIAAGWLSAAAGILTMILSEHAAAGAPFGELFRAATGRSLLAQAAAVAVCGVAAFYAARRPAGPRLAVLGAAAAGPLAVYAQSGHAATQPPVRLSAAMGGAVADSPAAGEAGAKGRVAGAGAPAPGSAGAGTIGSLQRSVRSEVALAAIVLLVAAVLSGLPPASSVEAAGQTTASPSVIETGSDFATTARVRLTASPGTVGPNRFQVQVLRYDANSPLPARSVRLEFSLPSNPNVASSLSLARSAGGTWTGQGTNLSIDGQWDIDVVVQETATAVDVPLRLRTRLPPEQITVSGQPGQPTLYTIQLAHGRSLQMYLQQIDPGHGVVHFTFFQTPEREASITSARATAITPGGAEQPLKLIRFGKGHLAANVKLIPGRWTFGIGAVPAGGPPLSGSFSQPVRP